MSNLFYNIILYQKIKGPVTPLNYVDKNRLTALIYTKREPTETRNAGANTEVTE